jgi:hypothetical protein
MRRLLACLALGLALAGCANLLPYSLVEGDESRQVIELIGYAQRVAALQPEEQRRELNASTQIFSKDPGIYGRVRLALLLALPGTAFNDDARAASLLEPPAGAGGAPLPAGPMQQFAGLLYAQVGERVREQRRTAQLKDQLDALRAIERQIIDREQGHPK